MTLTPGENAATEWVEAPVGTQVRWDWSSGDTLWSKVEARGIGLLYRDEDRSGHGCVNVTEPLALRLFFDHRSAYSDGGPAPVSYALTVEPSNGTCRASGELHRTGFLGTSFDSLFVGGFLQSPLFPGLVGNLGYAALRFATLWPSRHERRAAREQKILDQELRVQARERWVEQQVRARQGRGP